MRFLSAGLCRATFVLAPILIVLSASCGRVSGKGRDDDPDGTGGAVDVGDGDTGDSSSGGTNGDGDGDASGDGDGDGSGGDGEAPTGDGDASGTGGGRGDGSGGVDGDPPASSSCEDEEGDECEGESCCTTLRVDGGRFSLGRSEDSDADDYYPGADPNETPAVTVEVSPFYLDKYEVTVGRFRAFVEQYTGDAPKSGEGAAPGAPNSGWSGSFDEYIAPDRAALIAMLKCDPDDDQLEAWTDEPDDQERHPINCIDWWTAFQFCVWDGGRLPTEAEWEFAAAGGDENRLYPWGPQEPSCSRAKLDDCGSSYMADVGSVPQGAGRYGHLDLAGNVYEWVLDHYTEDYLEELADLEDAPVDPVDLGDEDWRSVRSSHMFSVAEDARNTSRQGSHPVFFDHRYGVRCARDPE